MAEEVATAAIAWPGLNYTYLKQFAGAVKHRLLAAKRD